MRGTKFVLNLLSVVCFIYGALYVFSLVFIPIGIYCFIAGKRFSRRAANLDDNIKFPDNIFRNYVIFVSICCFPFGLLSIIPFISLTGNNVKVHTVKSTKLEYYDDDYYSTGSDNASNGGRPNAYDRPKEDLDDGDVEFSLEEKQEQYEKLVAFNKKGLITDAELEQAREQLFGSKDKERERD